jgi:short-subunit dehydrogenase
VITGAAQGLGRRIMEEFAKKNQNLKIIAIDI